MLSPQAQLPLEGGRKPRFENYQVGSNAAALGALRHWLEQEDADACLLEGPSGCGKTHLLLGALWAWQQQGRPGLRVALGQGGLLPEARSLVGGLLAIDDLDRLQPEQCLGLMRAIDAAREGRWRLLLASRVPVAALELPFEDLRSRLQWGARLHLRPLDESGLAELLAARAAELGVQWPQRNSEYLLRRLPRQPAVLLAAFDAAYTQATATGRQLAVPLLTELLASAQFRTAVEQAAAEPEGAGQE